MAGGGSQFSWLDNLNALDPGSAGASPGQQPSKGADGLPDDLRAQLEAWTTVTFENDSSSSGLSPLGGVPGHHSGFMRDLQSQHSITGEGDAEYALKDPSPYAKRPFGNFGHNYSLERGFNAFDHSGLASDAINGSNNNTSFDEIYAGLGFSTINNHAVAGNADIGVSNGPLLDVPSVPIDQDALFAGLMQQQQQQDQIQVPQSNKQSKSRKASHSNDAGSDEPSTKKQRVTSSSTPVPSPAASASTPSSSSTTTIQKAPLSKAAILAAQLAELEAKKGLTPEEESARQAELNRVAAEDDKRRRNTAASARFRVKKKQREQALEETVKGLNDRIDKLEKDLEASRNENNFLRDLVIRKIGLSELANPGGAGLLSGGQEGKTGMGTQ